MTDKNLRRRLAAVIDQHHQADEWGYPVEECRCGDDRDGTETWADHLALVLSDLLMNEAAQRRHMNDYEREPVEIMARHADFVSAGVRCCTCGTWEDQSQGAQYTRVPFIHHVLAQLGIHSYAVVIGQLSQEEQ